MLPNIWFVISGFLLGASFWIDLSQRPNLIQKQEEQKQVQMQQKPVSISVKTVYRSNNNKTEWCIYHYEF